MTRRNWKRIQPTSLSHALELCLTHARERLNRSVDRVADQMGLTNKWVLYKWIQSGRIPAILIRPFETACGIDYVTRYLGFSAHKLLIDIPTGRRATGHEINDLHCSFSRAVETLVGFYDGKTGADEAISRLAEHMETVAWHAGNVERYQQPELALEEEDAT